MMLKFSNNQKSLKIAARTVPKEIKINAVYVAATFATKLLHVVDAFAQIKLKILSAQTMMKLIFFQHSVSASGKSNGISCLKNGIG